MFKQALVGTTATPDGKTCPICGFLKPASEFYKAPEPRCKECLRKKTATWRASNRSRARAYVRQWRANNPEKNNAQRRAYKARKSAQISANRKLQKAVHAGLITKPDICQGCSKQFARTKIHGHHHEGYSDPLKVQWLCVSCHLRAHGAQS